MFVPDQPSAGKKSQKDKWSRKPLGAKKRRSGRTRVANGTRRKIKKERTIPRINEGQEISPDDRKGEKSAPGAQGQPLGKR